MATPDSPATAATRPSATFIPALTGLRVPLALLVFLGHLSHLGLPGSRAGSLIRIPVLSQRTTAVGIFFALSGFVLTTHYTPRLADGRETTAGYLSRRIARLLPLYLLSVLLNIPGGLRVHESLRALALQLAALQSWSHNPDVWFSWNGAAWSLSSEAFFYLVFPVLLQPLLTRVRTDGQLALAWLVTWALLLAIWVARIPVGHARLGALDWWLYVAPPVRMLDFTLGALAAQMFRRQMWRRVPGWLGPLAGLFLAGYLLAVTGPEVRPMLYPTVVVPLTSLTLVWLACSRGSLARALGSRPLVRAGECSYAFYLLHVSGLALAGWLLARWGLAGSPTAVWPALAGALLVSCVVAALARAAIERPAQRLLLQALHGAGLGARGSGAARVSAGPPQGHEEYAETAQRGPQQSQAV